MGGQATHGAGDALAHAGGWTAAPAHARLHRACAAISGQVSRWTGWTGRPPLLLASVGILSRPSIRPTAVVAWAVWPPSYNLLRFLTRLSSSHWFGDGGAFSTD